MVSLTSYADLLKHGRAALVKYKDLRDHFTTVMCTCPDETCTWCQFCNLSTDDTGIEPCLTGVYFDQILKLNDYIYTTSSTNEPADATFQAMFIGFYAPKSVAEAICKHVVDKDYLYILYDEANKSISRVCTSGCNDPESIVDEAKVMADMGGDVGEFPDTLDAATLFDGPDRLVYVTIEDLVQERRDLYQVLAAFLTTLHIVSTN